MDFMLYYRNSTHERSFSMQAPAVCIAGWSNAGKTTLMERLIPALTTKGLRVGVIKHTHHPLPTDKPGCDTQRYRTAGASVVALAAPEGMLLTEHRPQNLTQALAALHEVDLVLVEGFDKEACLPTLEVWRDTSQPMRSSVKWRRALVTDLPCASDVPVFSPEDVEDIADCVLSLAAEQQTQADEAALTVLVNGQPLPIVPFVQKMLAGSLRGMLAALDGCPADCDVTINMKGKR